MEHNRRHPRDIDPSKIKVNLISALSRLIGSLESHRAPSRAEVSTTFLTAGHLHIFLPTLIHDKELKSGLPDRIDIIFTLESELPSSTLSVIFYYPDGDEFYVSIDDILSPNWGPAVLNPAKEPDPSSALAPEDQIQARTYPISRQELSKMIASILQPSPTKNYDNALAFDYLSRDEFNSITDALITRADASQVDKSIEVDSSEHTPIEKITYKERDGEIVHATITAQMNGSGRHVRAAMDQDNPKLVELGEIRGTLITPIDFETPVAQNEYGPGYDDLHRLIGFANNFHGRIKPPVEKLLGERAIDISDDEAF